MHDAFNFSRISIQILPAKLYDGANQDKTAARLISHTISERA
jgi:hypothetical protein